MKIGPIRIMSVCVLFCLAFGLATTCEAQDRSVLFSSPDGHGFAPALEDSLPRHVAQPRRVMQANRPSDMSSVLTLNRPSTIVHVPRPVNSPNVPQTASVIIKIEAPSQLAMGAKYRIYATVQNPTDRAIENLKISLDPSTAWHSSRDFAESQLAPRLGPRQQARFEFEVFGFAVGPTELSLTATGTFEAHTMKLNDGEINQFQLSSSQTVEIFRPSIRTEMDGPQKMRLGSEGTYSIDVINESGQLLPSMDVLLAVPDGLSITVLDRIAHKRADARIHWQLKNIASGTSELIQFKARAMHAGNQTQTVSLVINEQTYADVSYQTNILDPLTPAVQIHKPNTPVRTAKQPIEKLQMQANKRSLKQDPQKNMSSRITRRRSLDVDPTLAR